VRTLAIPEGRLDIRNAHNEVAMMAANEPEGLL
jgi:hypothetical protein